jgi:putative modified peptide
MHTPAELSAILDKLASDDGFREHLLGDPVAALGGLGISISPDKIPAVRSLPSKDAIASDRDTLHNSLVSNLRMVPFLLSGDGA